MSVLMKSGSAGAGGSGGLSITNSIRMRASASASLSRTPGAAGNRKLLTKRFRIKRGALGSRQVIASAGTASIDAFYFDSSDRLCLDVLGTTRLVIEATHYLRDPSAWYVDVGFTLDVANGTAASRAAILIDGTEVASYSTDGRASITNTDTNWNNTVIQYLGRDNAGSHLDGYFAEVLQVDGSTSVTSYSTTNTDGVRVPSTPSATYGTTGSLLDFKDAALTAGSNVGLGKDVSGNGNYWTTNNISVTAGVTYDSMVDTPTNSYCTLSPIATNLSAGAMSIVDGALTVTGTNATNWQSCIGTQELPAAKCYFEVTLVGASAQGGGNYRGFGVMPSNHANLGDTSIGQDATSWEFAIYGNSTPTTTANCYNNSAGTALTGALYADNTVYMVAVDASLGSGSNRIWIGVNGSWLLSGNPATNSTPVYSNLVDHLVVATSRLAYTNTTNLAFNFGQRPFTYTPPTGFKALCTANLPAVAITNPSNGFKITLATATNIDADVATARSGWPAYVDIKKNRSAAASWQYQFSHDSTNEYLIAAASVTRGAKSSNSGANSWVGYSIRIDSAYGTAAGSVSHTNGADTTVTHGVGVSARQLILLFPRAGGSVVRVYHPDLTAGSLLDLCSTAAQAVSATIKTVTSTSFKIDMGTATGTYDYLVISELSGFFKLFNYTSNNSTDGPYASEGHRSKMLTHKDAAATTNWFLWDTARDTYNVVGNYLSLDITSAETAAVATWDVTAAGIKNRATNSSNPAGSHLIVGAAFAEFPFGGSNCSPSPAR